MKKLIQMPTNLSSEEVAAFNRLCEERGESPSRRIGELIHGFLIAEGVKHRSGTRFRRRNSLALAV